MGRVGRPPKSLQALHGQFCDLLRKGLHRPHAAAQIGLTEAQVSEWYANGARDTKGIYREFHLKVNKAEAEFAQACLDTMIARGAADPKVIQWVLSRRFPEHFGRHDNVEAERPEDRAAQQQATRQLLIERLERLFPEAPEPSVEPVVEVAPVVEALPEASSDAPG